MKFKAIDGMRSDEIASIVGIHKTSVNRILAKYKAKGMEAMAGKRHDHDNRYMSREEEAAFLLQFQCRSEAGQIIETREIHQAYEKAVGHPVTRNMVYYLLHRHKWRKTMPRSRHEKKADEEAIEAYKKITEKIRILKKCRPKLRVMFQDEAGFGRINKPKRCWCRKGIPPSVPCHHIREYRYLYGAVSPEDGELFSMVMPYANTDCMNIFLEELSRAYPDDHILLLLDNAAWRHSSAMWWCRTA